MNEYATNLDCLEELDKFKNHSTFQVWNMKYKIWIDWSLVKRLKLKKKKQPPQNISPGPHGFSSEFSESFKDLIPVFLKPFQKIETGVLLNTFYEAIITLIPKSGKDNIQKRKLQANISDERRCKNLHNDEVAFIPGIRGWLCICKSINILHHINKMEDKNHTIISIDVEKTFDRF